MNNEIVQLDKVEPELKFPGLYVDTDGDVWYFPAEDKEGCVIASRHDTDLIGLTYFHKEADEIYGLTYFTGKVLLSNY
jgi:hypothetical protein